MGIKREFAYQLKNIYFIKSLSIQNYKTFTISYTRTKVDFQTNSTNSKLEISSCLISLTTPTDIKQLDISSFEFV